ncbi:MAG: sugar ABC transporter permease, partial [candidate division WOR-3 bacterium]|nr:sugar ABC transporter permease [candidate division WOR-3 bacterium]
KTYWEAATVDGANAWQRFRHVTLPLLSPTTFFVVVTGAITAIQTFVQPYIMGGGGTGGLGSPLNASLFGALYLYQQGFSFFNMGYASAISWMLTLIILFLTILNFVFSRFWVHYGIE